MKRMYFTLLALAVLAVGTALTPPATAYVEAPQSLGSVIQQSSHIMVLRVEQVDREKNLIVYRKVRDLKGTHPLAVIKHNIGRGGFHPREWQFIMEWAEPGKTAIFFHNGGASETCIGNYWYQAYPGGEWWNMSHGEPYLLRSFAGNVDKLATAVTALLAGQDVVVSCMVDGNKEDLQLKRAKVQRLKASLKLQDYNPKRDFVGWGGEDFRHITGMAGFTHYSALARVDPDAQAIAVLDIDSDGKLDLCLAGASKVALLQNGGESLNEVPLPAGGGCRAAVWADYNADGKPDLLLATSKGPKLLTNQGNNQLREDSHLLPPEPSYNLTAAAWMDYDGDGKTDILLGNGFHGLRLYRNKGKAGPGATPLTLSEWHYIGPFDYAGGQGFHTAYPPEREIQLTRSYPGKGGKPAVWKKGTFKDGAVNSLALFEPQNNSNAVVYLHRAIECRMAMELPISLGSDDTLTVWLNGQKLLAKNTARAAAPDQNKLVLKLGPGKNDLLLKVCQGGGDWAFFFAAQKTLPPELTWEFEDISERVGLGSDGIGGSSRGDSLTVCDVDGDHRPEFLYGAGTGLLVRNTPQGFIDVKDSGISYKPGNIGPVFGDFDGDAKADLFVPQAGASKLYRNLGDGKFVDVTQKAGDLARPVEQATCAALGDFDNDGRLDLIVGCLHGPNRYLRNLGGDGFFDASAEIGLDQRIFNTQALCLADLNQDGCLDLILNNEGQESAVLLGKRSEGGKCVPVTVKVGGPDGVVGSTVSVHDKTGKFLAGQTVSGGDGRGGQAAPHVRFALEPGAYQVVVHYSSGLRRVQEITIASSPVVAAVNDQTPALK